MPQHAIPESLTFPQLRFIPVFQVAKSISGQISPLSPRHIPSCLLQSLPGDPQPAQQQLIIQPSYTQIFSQTRSSIHFPQTQSVSGYLGNTASGSLPRALGPLTKPLLLAWKTPWTEKPGERRSPRGHRESDTAEQLSMHAIRNA